MDDDPTDFVIAGTTLTSRLVLGTGGISSNEVLGAVLEASGTSLATVAVRRVEPASRGGMLDVLRAHGVGGLPNTAGCYSADEAVRTLRLARELLDDHRLVKLEVLGDATSLYPNVRETLKAAEILVREGFDVMVYTSDDPIIARDLESIGCCAIMPLASLIGSGMGIVNPWNLRLIIESAKVPVLVDAGVGTASDAAIAMELGCDGILMNTAIAGAHNPVLMAYAMKQAVEAGRAAFKAGRMPKRFYSATPSSPSEGVISTCKA